MPFFTDIERMLEERGRVKGLQEGERSGLLEGLGIALEVQFNEERKAFTERLKAIQDLSKLREILRAISSAEMFRNLRKLL